MIDVKKVLRDKPGGFIGYFLPLLIMAEDNDKLLDVVELFGLDRLGEAVERLGGSTVSFPTWTTVDTLVRDAYLMWKMDTLIETAESRRQLSQEFDGMPFPALRERVRSLRASLRTSPTAFPGAKHSKKWLNGLAEIKAEIVQEVQNGG